jgi:hypothetical protein
VLDAIAAIETKPDAEGLLLEDPAYPGNYLCMSAGGIAIRIQWLDAGAFEVLSVRPVFIG